MAVAQYLVLYTCSIRKFNFSLYVLVLIYSSDVGFMAYPSSIIITFYRGKLLFDQLDRNDGEGYNVSTGVFTAPMAGMYHFFWSLLFNRGENVAIAFELNATRKVLIYRDTEEGTYSSTSGSIYLRLTVGDQGYLLADQSRREDS